MGDPAGVGPEIILKALQRKKVRDSAEYMIIGNRRVMENTASSLSIDFDYTVLDKKKAEFSNTPVLIETDMIKGSPLLPGKESAKTGRASLSYILFGTHLCKEKLADAIVTCPISKAAIRKGGCKYPGHTEFIADLVGAEKVVMMLTGGGLRVALVTTHASISVLPQLVTRGEIYASIIVTYNDLIKKFGIKSPRIAVLGLNPHAGEGGMLGNEEKLHIMPAIKEAADKGIKNITGPIAADTAFHRMLSGEFDAILAMYHDQGLGPLKTIAFDSGVNITLGLPIVRTSVDHGTAFDIAGKGVASEKSLIAAIETAVKLAKVNL
jgi:4-hydroxythreonine-4-phosphate dehydrogenase